MTDTFRDDFGLTGAKPKATDTAPGFKLYSGDMIAEAGAYRGVPISRYHGAEICPGPSASSTGLKVLASDKGQRKKGQTPRHYWERSSLNPARKPQEDTDALRLGRAFHDALLLPDVWDSDYHMLPEGFTRKATVKMAAEIAEADAAIAKGFTIVSEDEADLVVAMATAMLNDALIAPYLHQGEAEVTLAWQDKETGIWLRARPDWMLPDFSVAMNMKTDVDASYSGFSSSIAKYGYAQSAALELDGYEAVFGVMPRTFLHPVVEKPAKGAWSEGDYLATALWELPQEDIERGRWLNRMAIRKLADCLAANDWPGYTPEPELCGLPGYARHVIDFGGAADNADDEIKGE